MGFGAGVRVQVIFLVSAGSERLTAARPGAFVWVGIAVKAFMNGQMTFPLERLAASGDSADKGTLLGVHCLVKEQIRWFNKGLATLGTVMSFGSGRGA